MTNKHQGKKQLTPVGKVIQILSHGQYIVTFSSGACVQTSTLHTGTETAYELGYREFGRLLNDSYRKQMLDYYLYMKLYPARIKQGIFSHATDLAPQRSKELQVHLNTEPKVWGHILKIEGPL